MTILRFFWAMFLWGAWGSQASAALVGYEFSGAFSVVIPGASGAFQQTYDSAQPVHGTFIYDTESTNPEILDATKTARYLQQIPKGFVIRIGGVEFSTDTYFVEVANNRAQPTGGPTDHFGVLFHSDMFPEWLAAAQLNVAGTPFDTGVVLLDFRAQSNGLYSDYGLPASLHASQFILGFGFVADAVMPVLMPQLVLNLNVTSLQSVDVASLLPAPEGATAPLLLGGFVVWSGWLWRRRVSKRER